MFGFNTALKDKRFTVSTFSRVGYTNAVAYLYNQQTTVNDKNTSTTLNLGEDVRGTFRNDWFEFTVNGSINYNFEKNKLRPENNQEPYTFGMVPVRISICLGICHCLPISRTMPAAAIGMPV